MSIEALIATDDARVVRAEVADPVPAPDEALIEVGAFSINRGETYLLEHRRPGWRPGKDVAGIVVRAAADGSGPPAGRRVVGHPESGGWARLASVPTARLTALPDELSLVDAAALPLAGLTALRLARVAGSLSSRRVLLTGAAGGVGHLFVALAAAQGALVTALASGPARGARLLELGAERVVSEAADADGSFDIGIDSVGGATTAAVWGALATHGLLIWMGQASRVGPTLDFFDWSGGTSATLRRFDYMDSDRSIAADLATLVRLTVAGGLSPEVTIVEDWTKTSDVIGALLERRIRGSAVLTIPAANEQEIAA